jgi:putative tryptophan/tyrosine transport system substrate-binding protein
MKRRDFIALLGGAAASSVLWPLAARAQQGALPAVGFLRSASNAEAAALVEAFRQGLKAEGFSEGQNVAIEVRSAEGRADRLPAIAEELIRRPVAVLVGNTPAALAAKAKTTTLPIVFMTGLDPVRVGLVPSLNRPGGNVTGVAFFGSLLEAKRLELLLQVAPKATTIGFLVNPNNSEPAGSRKEVQAAAQTMSRQVVIVEAASARDLDVAFATLVERGASAVLNDGDAFFTSNRAHIVALAARYRLPAIYDLREFVEAGGLMSYAPSITDAFRQTGVYAGRILKGAKPGDLPVMQATKFELVLNLKTARMLGLEIPDHLLALADEVID